MRAAGKLHAALAEALGTPPAFAALMAAGSEAAAESAVADWRELLGKAGGTRGMGWTREPVGWPAAAQRVVQVLRKVSVGAGSGQGGAGSAGQG
eukprot:3411731-Pleurochrysis_carterae.AAC.1